MVTAAAEGYEAQVEWWVVCVINSDESSEGSIHGTMFNHLLVPLTPNVSCNASICPFRYATLAPFHITSELYTWHFHLALFCCFFDILPKMLFWSLLFLLLIHEKDIGSTCMHTFVRNI